MTRLNPALAGLCLLSVPVVGLAADPSSDVPEAVKSITGREIGGHLRFLASDLMKGRDTASPESRLAGEYLAAHLFAAGAEPGNAADPDQRSYFQEFPLEVVTPLDQGTDLVLTIDQNGSKRVVPCKLGSDFILRPHGVVAGDVDAWVVFAGFGRSGPDSKTDDYAGLDVKNQFVLVYEGQPEAPKEGPSPARRFDPAAKAEAARKHGAQGILVIEPPGRHSEAQELPNNARNQRFLRPSMSLGSTPAEIPALRLADPIRDLLVDALGLTAETRPLTVQGASLRVRFRYAASKQAKADRNVVGFFPGSDPEKKHEVILYSAHYDHVGVNEQGEIFNGSDDNASGTSALLEIAQALGQGPRPARTIAFLWVSGEEKGLLGSQWFANHSCMPAGFKVVADINLDMVSRNDPRKVGVTPSPGHGEYNSLVPAAQESCKAEEMEVVFDADQYFHRTDSSSFASKGVPVIFFFAGVHADYHRPSDDFDKADTEKAARVARAAYRLGWRFARGPELPSKIKAGAASKPGPA
jgi:Zn-dependent M28 family amino/carboxypeptidase